jgi:hypothetical protein
MLWPLPARSIQARVEYRIRFHLMRCGLVYCLKGLLEICTNLWGLLFKEYWAALINPMEIPELVLKE